MTIEEIRLIVNGIYVEGADNCDKVIENVFASDLMSDVLTLKTSKNLLLITGLANIQTIRTCEMADIKYVLFVRGKNISEDMIELANENEMMLMVTDYSLYRTSGLLYTNNIAPIY